MGSSHSRWNLALAPAHRAVLFFRAARSACPHTLHVRWPTRLTLIMGCVRVCSAQFSTPHAFLKARSHALESGDECAPAPSLVLHTDNALTCTNTCPTPKTTRTHTRQWMSTRFWRFDCACTGFASGFRLARCCAHPSPRPNMHARAPLLHPAGIKMLWRRVEQVPLVHPAQSRRVLDMHCPVVCICVACICWLVHSGLRLAHSRTVHPTHSPPTPTHTIQVDTMDAGGIGGAAVRASGGLLGLGVALEGSRDGRRRAGA